MIEIDVIDFLDFEEAPPSSSSSVVRSLLSGTEISAV
jgi:hypothetical protein